MSSDSEAADSNSNSSDDDDDESGSSSNTDSDDEAESNNDDEDNDDDDDDDDDDDSDAMDSESDDNDQEFASNTKKGGSTQRAQRARAAAAANARKRTASNSRPQVQRKKRGADSDGDDNDDNDADANDGNNDSQADGGSQDSDGNVAAKPPAAAAAARKPFVRTFPFEPVQYVQFTYRGNGAVVAGDEPLFTDGNVKAYENRKRMLYLAASKGKVRVIAEYVLRLALAQHWCSPFTRSCLARDSVALRDARLPQPKRFTDSLKVEDKRAPPVTPAAVVQPSDGESAAAGDLQGQKLTFREAAHMILTRERRPLSVAEIMHMGLQEGAHDVNCSLLARLVSRLAVWQLTATMCAAGIIETSGKTPAATLASLLYTEIKDEANGLRQSLFYKAAPRVFGLREWQER